MTVSDIAADTAFIATQPKYEGLTTALLRDIHSAHNAFQFAQYRFAAYTGADFVKDVSAMDARLIEAPSQREDPPAVLLYPSWLIDDDLFAVMQPLRHDAHPQ